MIDRSGTAAVRAVILTALHDRVFPAAVAEVGDRDRVLWSEAFGRLTFDESARVTRKSTVFDLASLTKPIATTSVVLQLVSSGRLNLGESVASCFSEWRGEDRSAATVRDLLEHASGLAARLIDLPPGGRREFEHDICTMQLEYATRATSIYSDLGFILLGFIAEDRGLAPLDRQFDQVAQHVLRSSPSAGLPGTAGALALGFGATGSPLETTAPTWPESNDARRGRTLVGEVHDDYAAALGGVAGHAGLFGSAAAVGQFARAILRGACGDADTSTPFTTAMIAQATTRSTVPGSSRALGWDLMLPTSSCGTRMSPSAFGHVGFTGTSLWIDPTRNRYYVLLTNRVCGGGTIDEMRGVRRAFHDALAHV